MQVINFYMCMLQERDDLLCEGIPGRKSSHFFNSFFMERLLISDHAYTYSNVRRWSKKFDSFAQDKIYFPVRVICMPWPAQSDLATSSFPFFIAFVGAGEHFERPLDAAGGAHAEEGGPFYTPDSS